MKSYFSSLFCFLFVLLISHAAKATCSPVGKMRWNTGSGGFVEYCDSNNWISTKHSALGTCTGNPVGKIRFNLSSAGNGGNPAYEFCDGTTWYSMFGSWLANCSGAEKGKLYFNPTTKKLAACDGTSWILLDSP